MTHLGILLACEHCPTVSTDPGKLDARLRNRLSDLGHDVTEVSLFDCHLGQRPRSVGDCDVWIVSGSPLGCDPTGLDLRGLVIGFLRGVVASGRPIFALHHGEHILHAALACPSAPAPDTAKTMHAIRNPFSGFGQKDTLFRFDATHRAVLPTHNLAAVNLAA